MFIYNVIVFLYIFKCFGYKMSSKYYIRKVKLKKKEKINYSASNNEYRNTSNKKC
jgi:hypothetical protein